MKAFIKVVKHSAINRSLLVTLFCGRLMGLAVETDSTDRPNGRLISSNPLLGEQQMNAVNAGDGYRTPHGWRALHRLAGAVVVRVETPAVLSRIIQGGGPLSDYSEDTARNTGSSEIKILQAQASERDRQRLDPDQIQQRISAARSIPGVTSAGPVFIEPASGLFMLPTEEIVVRLKPGVDPERGLASHRSNARAFLGSSEQFIVRLPGQVAEEVLAECDRLMGDDNILWAEPNFLNQSIALGLPDDKYFPRQWHLLHNGQLSGSAGNGSGQSGADINVSNAWNFTTGSTNIIVAVLDDGIQLSHPDLAPNLATNLAETLGTPGVDNDGNGYVDDVVGGRFGISSFSPDANPQNATNNHGTCVAGLAVARGSNAVDVAGVAYTSKLLPINVLYGPLAPSDMAAAFYYAGGINAAGATTWRGADILNMSFGTVGMSTLDDALSLVATRGRGGIGCPIFVAAGNDSKSWQGVEFSGFANGAHTFRCEFVKDAGGSAGQDAAWLGDVQFPGQQYEHFEGATLPAGWTTGGASAWTVDHSAGLTFGAVKGALRSGVLGDSQTNWVQITWTNTVNFTGRGFAYVRSSTAPGDEIRIYMDGVLMANFSGVVDDNLGIFYPASHPAVISVGATTDYNLRSDYSQFGTNLTLVAPGGGGRTFIFTTDRTGTDGYQTSLLNLQYQNPDCYERFSGTSAASPIAAGVGALVLSANTNLNPLDVRQIMTSTAVHIGNEPYLNGRNDFFGYGKVDASAAVLGALDYSFLPPDTKTGRILARSINIPGISPSIGTNQGDTTLEILYGGTLTNASGTIGQNGVASGNLVVVGGTGSRWVNTNRLTIGFRGSANVLLVTNGAVVSSGASGFGDQPGADNNLAVVAGTGSLWTNTLSLFLGSAGSGNQLLVTNGGTVVASNLVVGSQLASINNRVTVDGGTLHAALDIRRGTNVLNAGSIVADTLQLRTNTGHFEFNGGSLSSGGSTVTNGILFSVGNGIAFASFTLTGSNLHTFNAGLTLKSNATLAGNGTISGVLTVQPGATFAPGVPQSGIGSLILSNPPSLQGAVLMELSAAGVLLTNDRIQVGGALTYGGRLIVTNIGTALANGNRFVLFNASSYGGAFTSITLPSLPAGLVWINNLMLDGSFEVATPTSLVWTTADSGAGSLRQAVTFANASGTASVITFSNTIASQTIVLTSGQITLSNASAALAIDASGLPGGIAISGNNSSRVFEVATGAVVNLNALTIRDGYAPNGDNPTNYGGGILNQGTLTLTNCALTGNQALQGSKPKGGAIGNYQAAASLTLQNCLVSSNHSDAYGGGGIDLDGGVAGINQCTFIGNTCTNGNGGAIGMQGGTVILNQCTVSGNSASIGGGVARVGTLVISNSIVAGNVAASNPNIAGSFTGTRNITSGNPLLASLGNYGGSTQTMPLMPGSPAIDGCTSGTGFSTDQRGQPRIMGAFADIGAVEGVLNPSFPLVNLATLGDSSMRFSFTNLSGLNFTVLASTNVAAPINAWSNLGPALESPPGTFSFSDLQATNFPQRFYRAVKP